jgi:hypothetical protein
VVPDVLRLVRLPALTAELVVPVEVVVALVIINPAGRDRGATMLLGILSLLGEGRRGKDDAEGDEGYKLSHRAFSRFEILITARI